LQHTFLFEEGYWKASGYYYTETGQAYQVEGQVRIYHEDNLWINDGVMKVVGQESIEIRNRYEVIPWEEGQELTTWVSVNPGLGVLEGTFTITDDCIISAYKAEKGEFSGAEVLIQASADRYLNRGVLVYKGKEKLSSWSVELNRVQNLQAY
jgi:hypothetical protein